MGIRRAGSDLDRDGCLEEDGSGGCFDRPSGARSDFDRNWKQEFCCASVLFGLIVVAPVLVSSTERGAGGTLKGKIS